MQPIDQPLNGKILLITGGASGIGLALVKQAHDIGARVLVADLKTTPDFDTYAADKENILYVQSDVTKWAHFDKIFKACEEKWSDVPDAYGICAGLFDPPFSNFWDDPEQDSGYAQVDVNVNHPIKLTRLAIRKSLSKGKRASVCIIASIAGISGSITAPIYCATKHAMVGFVKSMKDTEPLTGVKVTGLCPGTVLTPLFTEDKIRQYSLTKEQCMTPESCAAFLLDLLQKKEYPCGTLLEVKPEGHRIIPVWNIPPPEGKGTGQDMISEEIVNNMLAPIKAVLEREKHGQKL